MIREGSLNMNVNLLKAPGDIVDHIILHDLSSKNKGAPSPLLGFYG